MKLLISVLPQLIEIGGNACSVDGTYRFAAQPFHHVEELAGQWCSGAVLLMYVFIMMSCNNCNRIANAACQSGVDLCTSRVFLRRSEAKLYGSGPLIGFY